MYKHVEKCDCPQPKGVCVLVCAQWILKDSLLQTIKLRSGPCCLALLNKHAPNPPTQPQEWQWIDIVPAKVRFKYHSTSQGRLVTFTTTAPAVPLLLTLHNPPPPLYFFFFFHHFSHPQTPYHTLPSFPLPRELCSFLCSNNTLLRLRNLSNSEGKLSFIHLSNIRHSFYPTCGAKEGSQQQNNHFIKKCHNIHKFISQTSPYPYLMWIHLQLISNTD